VQFIRQSKIHNKDRHTKGIQNHTYDRVFVHDNCFNDGNYDNAMTYAIQDLPYAFPCKGGIGEEYCSGYHAGAIQADKDDNANRNLDLSQHRCVSITQQYCYGFVNGYND
jgi:hypothetical protein